MQNITPLSMYIVPLHQSMIFIVIPKMIYLFIDEVNYG